MAPRVAKKDRGEPPKPVIRNGGLGFYPIKPLALWTLAHGQCDAVIGHKDAPQTLQLKEQPALTIRSGKAAEPVNLGGKVFNGFSDAFYRGVLPQVILVVSDAAGLKRFAEEFLDHLEKLFSLGFFLPQATHSAVLADPLTPDPVDQLVPCFVVANNGIVFASLLKQLAESLHNMTAVDEETRTRILGKFTRGLLNVRDDGHYEPGQPVHCDPLRTLKLAGGSAHTQKTVLYILQTQGVQAVLESRVANPVDRLELENALWRVFYGILPSLHRDGLLSAKEAKTLQTVVPETILQIGKQIRAFSEEESLETLLRETPIVPDAEGTTAAPSLISGDSILLGSLSKVAESLNLGEETQSLKALKQKVLDQLQTP
jgi:hypothetical protein